MNKLWSDRDLSIRKTIIIPTTTTTTTTLQIPSSSSSSSSASSSPSLSPNERTQFTEAQKEALLSQFKSATKTDVATANQFLSANNWNVIIAIQKFNEKKTLSETTKRIDEAHEYLETCHITTLSSNDGQSSVLIARPSHQRISQPAPVHPKQNELNMISDLNFQL
eukprot:TRINITY_DN1490_c0_g1_i2.p1 TRINITY_DN1490_c0_g1~~TRINITY_DN1490_c0_g1_i2.p1  ORF type:complete len:166 (-),score=56.98 TRINITY_DN1490_c0_g1_i2:28-525(-)